MEMKRSLTIIPHKIIVSAALLLSAAVVSLTASFSNAIRHFAKTLKYMLKV